MKAMIVETQIRMAEMPEARNAASEEEIPACWNRSGEYCFEVSVYLYKGEYISQGRGITHI
jgi:hypothetical protein